MIIMYVQSDNLIQSIELTNENQHLIQNALWIDLLNPSKKDEKMIEHLFNLDVPTKEEMNEIEPSSRLYVDEDSLFMTVTMVAQSDTLEPKTDAITFILTENTLVTVRYIEPQSFKSFISRLSRLNNKKYSKEKIFIGLLENSTDRLADILEKVSHEFDNILHTIFQTNKNQEVTTNINYKSVLQQIGVNGDLGTKAQESLVSFIRMLSFFEQTYGPKLSTDLQLRVSIINKDIKALSDYAGFISTKVNFLVDATLGMVNIEQNNIIKIFSVAAVIFLPPTLIASIYGMNFNFMPELHWHVGYPIAIVLMLISAWIPFRYFKKKKWL